MPDGVEFDVKFKIDEVEARMKHIEDSIGNVANNTDKHTKRMGESFRQAGGEADKLDASVRRIGEALMAYMSVNAIIGLGRSIIEVRSEFEKFTSVLTTAYGNAEKANRAMNMLKETAKETPFQLTELAQAFVLLKNRGVDPAKESLIKAGDFASSTGRTFQELSEALLNIGELEVWKKFGVNASVQGDKIKLSFRGLTMQVEKSTAGVLKAVEAFGSIKGISGSMQGQMETLGGKVSNMKDAWDQLLNSLGKSAGWKNSITWLTSFIEKTDDFFKGMEGRSTDAATASINKFTDSLKGMTKVDAVKAINNRIGDLQKTAEFYFAKNKEDSKNTSWISPDKEVIDRMKIRQELLKTTNKEIGSLKAIVDVPWTDFSKWFDKMFSPEAPPKPPVLGLLEALNKQLKDLKEKRETVGSEAEIAIIDRTTESINKQILIIEDGVKRINDLKYDKKFPLQKVVNIELDKTLKFEKNKTTNDYQLTTKPNKLTQVDKDIFNNSEAAQKSAERISIEKHANESILTNKEDLFDEISKLNRKELKDRLQKLQVELYYQKGNFSEQKKLYEEIDKVVLKLNDDSYTNVMDTAEAIKSLAQVIGGELGSVISGISSNFQSIYDGADQFKKGLTSGNFGQSALGAASIFGGLYSIGKSIDDAQQKAWHEEQQKYYESQQKYIEHITKLIEIQTKALKDLQGTEKISGKNTALTSLNDDLKDIEKKAQSNVRILNGFKQEGNIFSRKLVESYADLSKVSMEELINIRDEYLKGNVSNKYGLFFGEGDFAVLDDYVTKYQETQDKIKQIQNEVNADLTGSTYDSILSGIVDAFADGMMSADEFSNNFEGSMKKALLNAFSREFLETQLQGWYDTFTEASKGGLTSTEIENLRLSLQTITTNAQTGLQTLLNASGLDLTAKTDTSSSSSLSGAIKSIQEDTANVLAGNINAIRINVIEQKDIALLGYQQLMKIERNTFTLFEIRDLLKGSSSNELIKTRANGG